MANLNQYGNRNQTDAAMEEASQSGEGQKLFDKASHKAGGKVTGGVKRKLFGKKTGDAPSKPSVTELASKARNSVKEKGLIGAMKDGIRFKGQAAKGLLKNPMTWGVLALVLIFGKTAENLFADDSDAFGMTQDEFTTTLLTESGDLSEDGVAVLMSDCPKTKPASDDVHAVDKNASMEANARLVYSVFKSYGLSNEKIAGMLGNMQHETDIVDPTCIEGIYNEPNQVGPRKQEAFADLNAWTTGTIFPLYEKRGVSISKPGYMGLDGNYYCGIGLIQWTGEGAEHMISIANAMGKNWWSMDFQLAYMLSDTHYRKGFLQRWMGEGDQSVSDAAYYFAKWYEGNTSNGAVGRIAKAEEWLPIIETWEVDTAYVQSVMALSTTMGGVSGDTQMAKKADQCGTSRGDYDNSSMASAMVSYAHPSTAAAHNDGTELYQAVHRAIFPGDSYFKSCDRSVACAVRWSGSDDTYPAGNTGFQLNYLKSSDKWESVGMAGSLTAEDLLPGDVFCVSGHTFMYVGTELVHQYHPDTDASYETVSGSLEDYSPGCCNQAADILSRNGQDWNGHGEYEVFRCVKPDNSPKYKDAGSTVHLEP